jgi:hypothetical protein
MLDLWEEPPVACQKPLTEEIRAKIRVMRTILEQPAALENVVQSRMLALVGLIQSQRARIDATRFYGGDSSAIKLVLRTYRPAYRLPEGCAENSPSCAPWGPLQRRTCRAPGQNHSQGRLRICLHSIVRLQQELWLTELYSARRRWLSKGQGVKPSP